MKICLVGDTHFRTKTPSARTDDNFEDTCISKLNKVLEIAVKNKCTWLIQAGDFFDIPNPSNSLIIKVIKVLQNYKQHIDVAVIHGQHDLRYHTKTSRQNSVLSILHNSGLLYVMDGFTNLGSSLHDEFYSDNTLIAYGCSFGDEIPEPKNVKRDHINICVAHMMVGDKPLYPGHDITKPEEIIDKHKGYDLFFFGDYHYPYEICKETERGKVYALNAGSLLRLTIKDRDRKPKVYIYDTYHRDYETVELEVEDVFEDKIENEKKDNSVERFINRLKKSEGIDLNFRENLDKFYRVNKTGQNIKRVIEENYG